MGKVGAGSVAATGPGTEPPLRACRRLSATGQWLRRLTGVLNRSPACVGDPGASEDQPGQTLDSAPPSTSMILPVTQDEAGVAR